MSDKTTVTLLRLEPKDYASLVSEDGQSLTDLCPEQCYVLCCGERILEIAPEITSRMFSLGFSDGKETSWMHAPIEDIRQRLAQ